MDDQTSFVAGNRPGFKASPSRESIGRNPEDFAHNRLDGMGPIQGVTEGASSVLGDAFDLAELQAKLLRADAKSCGERAKLALLGLVVTLALLIAALPVIASGLAQWMAWGLDWPLWICQLSVGFVFTALGLVGGYLCLRRLKSSLQSFESSQREAADNIRWLRQALSRTFPM